MNLEDTTIKGSQLIRLLLWLVPPIFVLAGIYNRLGNLVDDVSDIRSTQLENTRKTEIKDQVIEKRLNTIESENRLINQRISNLENNK